MIFFFDVKKLGLYINSKIKKIFESIGKQKISAHFKIISFKKIRYKLLEIFPSYHGIIHKLLIEKIEENMSEIEIFEKKGDIKLVYKSIYGKNFQKIDSLKYNLQILYLNFKKNKEKIREVLK